MGFKLRTYIDHMKSYHVCDFVNLFSHSLKHDIDTDNRGMLSEMLPS